ncbi:GTP-binding protein [Candidatus Bathyarchaeota archaeon]|nr:GTP-binding protein [Candidatus Bathyarchaeota archaeon]
MNISLPFDHSFKLIFGGAGGVGKSTLLHSFMYNEFIPDMKLTIGVQFNTTMLNRNGRTIGLSLWDLGGQERFRFIQTMYLENAHAGFIFFDMSRLGTLGQVGSWIDMYREYADPALPIILVGTKLDLVPSNQQAGIHGMANRVVQDYGLVGYTATSSKMNLNVNEVITYMVDVLVYRQYVELTSNSKD